MYDEDEEDYRPARQPRDPVEAAVNVTPASETDRR
jgi:hypothetical protein